MYFNAQRVRKSALRTTSHGWVSIFPVSQNAGRVIAAKCSYRDCLILGVQSTGFYGVDDSSKQLKQ